MGKRKGGRKHSYDILVVLFKQERNGEYCCMCGVARVERKSMGIAGVAMKSWLPACEFCRHFHSISIFNHRSVNIGNTIITCHLDLF